MSSRYDVEDKITFWQVPKGVCIEDRDIEVGDLYVGAHDSTIISWFAPYYPENFELFEYPYELLTGRAWDE